ncbi:MAG: chorismate-binding protein [Eudoraea sp.]|nr:chorismate-binding protein [Eudoraea sp.]
MPYQENKSSTELFSEVDACLDKEIPFVLYKLPGVNEINWIVDNQESANQDTCFVFHPFDAGQKEYSLSLNSIYTTQLEDIPDPGSSDTVPLDTDTSAKNKFINLVKDAQHAIGRGEFQKVVLSRPVVVPVNRDPKELFCHLAHTYSNAFCYWWYHPTTGQWLGASPELLLATLNNEVEVMSLAGTRKSKAGETVAWNEKEKEEQSIVTGYIRDILEKHGSVVTEEGPETIQAGSLEHLSTQFKATLTSSPANLVKELHPTPAICGVPKDGALQFIERHEGYARKYYTGYLGLLSDDPEFPTQLYVNLRCMSYNKNKVTVYVGCGITAASDPHMEWQETIDKCQTMFKILDISSY